MKKRNTLKKLTETNTITKQSNEYVKWVYNANESGNNYDNKGTGHLWDGDHKV